MPARRGGASRRRRGPAILATAQAARPRRPPVWLFDLDNTLHDASHAAFAAIHVAMSEYIVEHLGYEAAAADALRQRYWQRYGATLLGLVRHHGVQAAHFLEQTHRLPGLEERLRTSAHDRAALARLRGRKLILTNAPRAYARRVLDTLDLARAFERIVTVEDMTMYGEPRPKPDTRMLRRLCARLKVPPARCILVEDTLQHQRAARSIGMRAVWMRRYLGGRWRGPGHAAAPPRPSVGIGPRACPKPAYVYARIRSLQELPGLR